MPGITEFLLNGGIGAISFFGGRHWEKRDQKWAIINEKVRSLTDAISQLSNAAAKYYICEMDERTISAETAMIGTSLKRINVELHCLCQLAKVDTTDYLDVVRGFHQAVTSDPFGESLITPVDADNCRILEIQSAEEAFVRKLKFLERV